MPWLDQYFRAVHIHPLDEASTLAVLQTRKQQFEKYYDVAYSDDAIEFAAHSLISYLSEGSLLVKALELLDAAGALVKSRQSAVPDEILEIQKRINFISHRMGSAVVNHEFEKARFYSNELNKEKENLRALKERLQPESPSSMIVGKEEVAEVVSRWAIYPYRP
jgi:ATP-dependent Clp protease ATP-binding subunit ClpC